MKEKKKGRKVGKVYIYIPQNTLFKDIYMESSYLTTLLHFSMRFRMMKQVNIERYFMNSMALMGLNSCHYGLLRVLLSGASVNTVESCHFDTQKGIRRVKKV